MKNMCGGNSDNKFFTDAQMQGHIEHSRRKANSDKHKDRTGQEINNISLRNVKVKPGTVVSDDIINNSQNVIFKNKAENKRFKRELIKQQLKDYKQNTLDSYEESNEIDPFEEAEELDRMIFTDKTEEIKQSKKKNKENNIQKVAQNTVINTEQNEEIRKYKEKRQQKKESRERNKQEQQKRQQEEKNKINECINEYGSEELKEVYNNKNSTEEQKKNILAEELYEGRYEWLDLENDSLNDLEQRFYNKNIHPEEEIFADEEVINKKENTDKTELLKGFDYEIAVNSLTLDDIALHNVIDIKQSISLQPEHDTRNNSLTLSDLASALGDIVFDEEHEKHLTSLQLEHQRLEEEYSDFEKITANLNTVFVVGPTTRQK